jgi:hypothetical protein
VQPPNETEATCALDPPDQRHVPHRCALDLITVLDSRGRGPAEVSTPASGSPRSFGRRTFPQRAAQAARAPVVDGVAGAHERGPGSVGEPGTAAPSDPSPTVRSDGSALDAQGFHRVTAPPSSIAPRTSSSPTAWACPPGVTPVPRPDTHPTPQPFPQVASDRRRQSYAFNRRAGMRSVALKRYGTSPAHPAI